MVPGGATGSGFREVLHGVKFQSGCCRRQGEPEAEDAEGEDTLFGVTAEGDHLQVQVFRESVSGGEEFFAPLGGCCCMAAALGWRQGKQGGPDSELAWGSERKGNAPKQDAGVFLKLY